MANHDDGSLRFLIAKGVKLLHNDRQIQTCTSCKFRGDTIYYNRDVNGFPKKICVFCEIKAEEIVYAETLDCRQDTNPELSELISRSIMDPDEMNLLPELRKLCLSTHMATLTAYASGSLVIHIYRVSFVDDPPSTTSTT
jgi:hypothetical protein